MAPCLWLRSILPANRRNLFLFVAVLLLAGTQSRAGYEFSISASDADPGVHTGAPSGGYRHLYLWLVCTDEGLAAFEAGVASTLEIAGFTPLNGVLNAGSGDDILLAVPGCPTGSLVLGRWTVWDDGGTFCLGESSTGVIGGVDCDPVDPELHDDVVLTGFSSSGSNPCAVGSDGCVGDGFSQEESGGGSIGSEWEP